MKKRRPRYSALGYVKGHPEYCVYHGAKQRCGNPKAMHYSYYGGRGIEFRFTSFKHFIDSVGSRPSPEMTIDRIDSNGHYEPGNVRWATRTQQIRNSRQAKLTIEDASKIKILILAGYSRKEIAELFSITTVTVRDIIRGHTWKEA